MWDSVPAYNLSRETVDVYLQGLFGYYDFYTRVWPLRFFEIIIVASACADEIFLALD